MHPEPDNLQTFICECRAMEIEELKESIDNWEENTNWSNQVRSLDIAKTELELKYKERQEQIELLTKSLTSSSRMVRWISSIRAIFN